MHFAKTRFAAAVALMLAAPVASGQVAVPFDHYQVYSGFGPNPNRLVTLADQFGSVDVTIQGLQFLLTPTQKTRNGVPEPVIDTLSHYTAYFFQEQRDPLTISVQNQFGEGSLTIGDGFVLLTPALKNPLIGQTIPDLNHFKCYFAAGAALNEVVTMDDQFDSVTATLLDPFLFCTPVEKTVDGVPYPIRNPEVHLTCYSFDPPNLQGGQVVIRDQFSDATMLLGAGEMLCVPSTKIAATPAEPSTWGRIKSRYR